MYFKLAPMLVLAWLLAVGPALARERLAFIGVALDVETRQADRSLQDYLYRTAGIDFAPEELEYGRVIERLANWEPSDGQYLARATPYVYVAAEMLGANFEIVATYVSAATGRTTYNAYFVVRRADFSSAPDLDAVLRFVRDRPEPARFAYHSRFSTSSYFLPSLFFRDHKIFSMPESTESLVAIHADQIEQNSSSELVRAVARGDADLAAVFDGVKAKFEPGHPTGLFDDFGDEVYFVQLPTALPNDLLVCSRSLAQDVKDAVRSAIDSMGPEEIGQGDFRSWQDVREATDARRALAELRSLARARTTPVTVDVRPHEQGREGAMLGYLEAIRQAVRLSGSEYVMFDEDFHEQIDFVWTVEPIHDGAIAVHAAIPGSGLDEQVFQISFRDGEGLTKRIGTLIESRIPRIRYVWPYSPGAPVVIRDTATAVPAGTDVKLQRIRWLDHEKNSFRAGPVFDVGIENADFYKYELANDELPLPENQFDLDAMSNVAYRVILSRPYEEMPVFRALTVLFVGLLLMAAGAAAFDLRRGPQSEVRDTNTSDDTRAFVADSDQPPRTPSSGPAREGTEGPGPKQWH